MKILLTPWMTAIVSVLIYLGATVAFWKNPTVPPPAPAVDAVSQADMHQPSPSWDFVNPEADQLIGELKAEKAALAKKEQNLNDLQARLDSERSELSLVTQSVRQLQNDFDKNVVRIGDEESANLKKLGKVYADMDPANAAAIMQNMDDPSVIKIMAFMKDSETAGIFEAMAKKSPDQARRAADLSERLRLVVANKNNTAPK